MPSVEITGALAEVTFEHWFGNVQIHAKILTYTTT